MTDAMGIAKDLRSSCNQALFYSLRAFVGSQRLTKLATDKGGPGFNQNDYNEMLSLCIGNDVRTDSGQAIKDLMYPLRTQEDLEHEVSEALKSATLKSSSPRNYSLSTVTDEVVIDSIGLGSFTVSYNIAPNELWVIVGPHKNNVYVSGHIHPHVCTTGTLCAGNVSHIFWRIILGGYIMDTLEMTGNVLKTYCERSPYVYLHNFQQYKCQVCTNTYTSQTPSFDCVDCGSVACIRCTLSCWNCRLRACIKCRKVAKIHCSNCGGMAAVCDKCAANGVLRKSGCCRAQMELVQ